MKKRSKSRIKNLGKPRAKSALRLALKMLCLKPLLASCGFFAWTESADADIVSTQEQPGHGHVLVNNPTAVIGHGEKQVKTPWMFMTADGKAAFANDFTTNAISVVTQDGTNYYAHIQAEDGDRTQVIHFTVNEHGIPGKFGDVINTVDSGEKNNATKMEKRKLMAVKDGYLYFFPTDEYATSLIYNPQTNDIKREYGVDGLLMKQKCLAIGPEDSPSRPYSEYHGLWILRNRQNPYTGDITTSFEITDVGTTFAIQRTWDPALSEGNIAATQFDHNIYVGDSDGKICKEDSVNWTAVAQLPGAVSGLSNNGDEFFATSAGTNAFYNLTLGAYNVVKDENGNPKPMVPKTKEGLLRVIDNRKKAENFCV